MFKFKKQLLYGIKCHNNKCSDYCINKCKGKCDNKCYTFGYLGDQSAK